MIRCKFYRNLSSHAQLDAILALLWHCQTGIQQYFRASQTDNVQLHKWMLPNVMFYVLTDTPSLFDDRLGISQVLVHHKIFRMPLIDIQSVFLNIDNNTHDNSLVCLFPLFYLNCFSPTLSTCIFYLFLNIL